MSFTNDLLIRAVHKPLNLRLVAAMTTDVCQTGARRHKTSAAAGCALGRGLTGGLLLATLTRGGERVTMQLVGNGPLQGLTIDAYDDGSVRGYPLAPQACAEKPMNKRQILANLIGRSGVVNVMRDVGLPERFQGQVSLVTSEIDEDLEAYLRQSEQIPSALGCELIMDDGGQVLSAGGVLLQSMPNAPTETATALREAQHMLRGGDLYDRLAAGPASPLELAQLLLGRYASDVEVLDERPLQFRCRCDRGRIEAMIAGQALTDLDEMIAEGQAEVTCNFCGEVYVVGKDDLLRLREQKQERTQN
jgi:molecular chaperone Hsp33